ncbi:Transposable element Tcb1 transposase, partial [Camponotus floridanus]
NVSRSTIRNRLREAGLRARTAARGPMMNVRHCRARLAYAREHVNWRMRDWDNVLFSDESRFCLYGNDRRPRVWRRQGERYSQNFIRPVAAYNGGSVMVWAGVSRTSRTPLVIVRDNLNARRYIDQILRPYVVPL